MKLNQVIEMPALVRHSRRIADTGLTPVQIPEPGPHEILIGVEAAGVCGTDVEFNQKELDLNSRIQPPVILGHEGAGVILGLGDGVSGLEVGQRVTAETTYSVCGECIYCADGRLNLCPERKGLGSGASGFIAPYIVVPSERVHVLPIGVTTDIGALTEPLACAVHAVIERAQVRETDVVLTLGPGPIGLMTAMVSTFLGAKTLLVGTSHSLPRLNFAENWQLAQTFNSQDPESMLLLKEEIGLGVNVIFNCSGNPRAFYKSMEFLRPGGRYIILGEIEQPVHIDTSKSLLRYELTITGSRSSIPSSWNTAMELLKGLKDCIGAMIAHRLPLSEWEQAFELVKKREGIKTILIPDELWDPAQDEDNV